MIYMKGYSYTIRENHESYAMARVEGIDASFKDLSEICGRMNNVSTERALELLEKFSAGELPVLYKSHNTKIGTRRELGGKKGRYPRKASKIVLNLLKSAIANAMGKGMIEPYLIVHLSANKKRTFPRLNPKGRRGRSDYETARVEIVIREKEIVKKEPKKKEKETEKKEEMKKPKEKEQVKEEGKPKEEVKKETKKKEPEKKTESKKEVKKVEKKDDIKSGGK